MAFFVPIHRLFDDEKWEKDGRGGVDPTERFGRREADMAIDMVIMPQRLGRRRQRRSDWMVVAVHVEPAKKEEYFYFK
jgi:hypothetical protein